ncbi:MAG: hypothetical protein JSV17_10420 [Candidatus Aminicenantes bacterium]|nr:MAG: hypothetical protein JSV17_10420 [Candidatus Aminicenantes bacterium]
MVNVSKSKYLLFGGYVLLCLLAFVILQNERSLEAIQEESLKLYPHMYDRMPRIPSPYMMKDGTEIVVAFMKGKKYACLPVTVENGDPLIYARGADQMGKGKQLDIDAKDFPTLAETGLHSEIELDQTKTITGRSVATVTEIGRPERSSGAGFMSQDEDIISVLKGDNRLVRKMGLTHPQTAKALFHVWNLVFMPYQDIEFLMYNGKKIFFEIQGSRGWQDSIFNDEILGQHILKIWRDMESDEKEFLIKTYAHLDDEQLAGLIDDLSTIETGEMAFYYIMRYGFYEGHTDFRVDPIAVAFTFGLRDLEDLDNAFKGTLYNAFQEHFTKESLSRGMGK